MVVRMRTLRTRANQEIFATKRLTEARLQQICVQGRVIVRLVLLRDLSQLPHTHTHTGLLQQASRGYSKTGWAAASQYQEFHEQHVAFILRFKNVPPKNNLHILVYEHHGNKSISTFNKTFFFSHFFRHRYNNIIISSACVCFSVRTIYRMFTKYLRVLVLRK